ncbi:uncharacterized protein si:ch73-52p7.1 [Kryptolebias marmoratus]|uniref:uncharacterized protein si:ch73-52p7.1 n=1 Tax=Kryptolebias marmoratus TaxID=37003 RepID=UPI0007F90F20|nr:uncharacterized protein si:ch73-52p7.1 [Kryptolebias marmoratus]XP_017284757.1 uncharacterized protein si:ch73-52p7.1 [Kryptolebias marmoratus]
MPAFSPPALLLCLLVHMSEADLQLAYVTHSSFIYYSCSQDPQPCSTSSLTDCRCKNNELPTPQRTVTHAAPVFRMRNLTVWFTSPSNVVRLLNNSEVIHLTLIHCGPPGDPRGMPFSPLEGYFAVQHLKRLTVLNVPERPFPQCPNSNRAKSSNADQDQGFYYDTNRYKDSNMDLVEDAVRDHLTVSSTQIQDIFLGRELGAAHHEQARLGIIHISVLDWGANVKAYTVQTHIDSDGALPFPDLHLAKLPETSVIYVSFVY